ncbi:MAG: polysaccharide lyase family 8 super-sandwich domain-containing protein [Clostridium sp.]|uniref:polysaccharide lyase family 8 super-sandwich domain-containing protein n=1 Tax=Clostridium sp. TaxID=1506 RepID=UPI003F3D7E96
MINKYRKSMSKTLAILVGFSVALSNIEAFATTSISTAPQIEKTTDSFNGGYEIVEAPSEAFTSFWKNNVKPKGWDLRVYKEFNKPVGDVITENNNKVVKINLNKSVGFFQTAKNIAVNGNSDYEISTSIKSENLEVLSANSAHKPVSIRVEQFGADGKLVSNGRSDLIKLEGSSDWKDYKFTLKTKAETTQLKLIFVFDTGLSTGASGSIYIDNTKIEAKEVLPESVEIEGSDFKIGVGTEGILKGKVLPSNTNFNEIIFKSSNPEVVSIENNKFKGLKEGNSTITASVKGYESVSSTINIQVTDKIDIEKVDFVDYTLENGRSIIPEAKVYPKYTNDTFTLESLNKEVATVENGLLKTVNKGETIIVAKNGSGKEVGRFNLNVTEKVNDKYDILAEKVFDSLVPNKIMDGQSVEALDYIKTVEADAKSAWDSLNKDKDRTYLWSEFSDTTSNSSAVTKTISNILKMAKGFRTNGTWMNGDVSLLNDILGALDFFNENMYHEGIYYANWWDWQIGTPQKLNDVLIIMKDYMTDTQIKKQTDASTWYVKNARDQWRGNTTVPEVIRETVGANRTDMVKVVTVRSMITKEGEKIKEASNDILQELEYVSKGDGFYKDGSIVQHSTIAYTGTYGAILLAGIGETVYMLDDSEWALPMEKLDTMYNVVLDSFEPLIFNGLMMDMVSGRAISRATATDANHGTGVLKTMVKYYQRFAKEPYKTEFLSIIKGWLVNNDEYDFIAKTPDYEFKVLAKEIVNNKNIKPKKELEGIFNFANMDRVVYREDNFALGLSMYSKRIANYECINGENLKGFHTGDGMTYLYNGDLSQYSGNYYATVDPYRLSGTTVDTMRLKDGAGQKKTSKESFVGGATLEDIGAFSMQLDKSNDGIGQDLRAKKSYFMVDDVIVFLGTDITSTTDTNIETTVENRKLSKNGKEKITVDNHNSVKKLGDSLNKEVSWVHFEGEGKDNNIGYYFPNKTKINLKRENREGSWKDVNTGGSSDIVTDNYMTMWLDHGVKPTNGSYEYFIIPNASKKDMKEFKEENEIKIIKNEKAVQAIKSDDEVLAMNVFEDGETIVENFKIYNKASIIAKEDDNILELSISDPTMENKSGIKFEINQKLGKVIQANDRISVTKENGKTILNVDTNGLKGESLKIKFKI